MKRTVFSNTAETYVQPVKEFYGVIHHDGKDHLYTFEGKFRSVAAKEFDKIAKLNHGTFDGKIGVLN